MKILTVALAALMLIPAGWSLINLTLLLRNRHAPAEAKVHLLAVCSGSFLTAALWQGAHRQYRGMLLLGILGAACGLVWFYLVYRQSLHNTTM